MFSKLKKFLKSKRAVGSVATAIKVGTACVLGTAVLVGGVALTNDVVLPNTSDKVQNVAEYEGDGTGGSTGGVTPVSVPSPTQYNNESINCAELDFSVFNNCEIYDATIQNSTINDSNIASSSITGSNINDSNLTYCNAQNCNISGDCIIDGDGTIFNCTFEGNIIVSGGIFNVNPVENGCVLDDNHQLQEIITNDVTIYRVISGGGIND